MDAARKLYEEVIEGFTAQLGASHTETLLTKSNLANLQQNMGEVDAARTVLEEVVEVSVAQLGDSHRFTQFAKAALAQVGS